MTSTLPILTPSTVAHLGGRHTRNKRAVAVRTCETCPSEVKEACVAVCADMERFLLSNGATISHNSPLWGQMANGTVTELAESAADEATLNQGGGSSLLFPLANISVTATPESMLLNTEAAGQTETVILQHITAFCESAVKKDERERAVVESIIVLHYLEGYTINRTAEILGQRFEEYAGYRENERSFRSDRKKQLTAPKLEREPKGRFKVARTLKKFQDYIHTTHLSEAIHTVMVTGSVGPVKPFAVKA